MGDGQGSKNVAREPEFTGFYLVHQLSKLVRGRLAGYCLLSFLIVAIPALVFYLSGLQSFTLLSTSLFGGVFIFFLLSRWVNNIAIDTSERLVDKTHPDKKQMVTNLIYALMRRWFNPWGHLISGLALVFTAMVLAVFFGHPEWLYPATIILGFVAGVSIWLIGGTIYFWHRLATNVIGNLTPIDPLNPDRMGGYRFIASHIVTWTIIESIRITYVVLILITLLWEVHIPEAQVYFLIFFCIFVGIDIAGYFVVVYALHHGFVRAKQEIITETSATLAPLEEKITTLIRSSQPTGKWDQLANQIQPYAQSIIAVKAIIDEYRYMHEWPIDLPLVLKVLFAILTPFFLLAFQWIIQIYLGVVLPYP